MYPLLAPSPFEDTSMAPLSPSLRTALAFTMVVPLTQKGITQETRPAPPVAVRIPHATTHFGETLRDDYFWLRRRDDPKVLDYLKRENEHTRAVMAPTARLQETLAAEMIGRLRADDQSVPVRIGKYDYYTRMEKGRQYAIHCRRPAGMMDNEEILLDENELAAGHEYFALGVFRVSPDANFLAYSFDLHGNERYTVRIKDLTSGAHLPEKIEGTYDSLEWSNDSRFIFYNTVDAANRPFELYRHTLRSPQAADALIHHEMDEAYFLTLSKTRSRGFLLLELNSNTTTEIRYLDANDPMGHFRIVYPRQADVLYKLDHHGADFYITTNADGATNFALLRAPISAPEKTTIVLPHRPEVMLEHVDLFKDFLVASERADGIRRLTIHDLDTGSTHVIEQSEPVHMASLGFNPEFASNKIHFHYTSLITPDSVFEYDMLTRERKLLKEDIAAGSYDRSRYETKRIWAVAPDGTRVPISLVYRKGLVLDGSHPLLLEGYGAYGISFDPEFDSSAISLVDRGVIYAIAQVRGGGDLGRPWYEAGKMNRKQNTFTDFIACAEHLIAEKYTSADRLAITGTSAGGLLVGAVVNMRPDLFKVAIAKVPFVDVINTMMDETIPLTVIEWEEWGNPHEEADYRTMRSYSPYDNVAAKEYPHLLITAGLNDPRVGYWEPAKWAARLRATKGDDRTLLLHTDMESGHAGPTGRFSALKERAFEAAFLLEHLPKD
jgi:oligopeptidase B